MKFCKKCHKRIVEKIKNHCELALEKICTCNIHMMEVDKSLSGSVDSASEGTNKIVRIYRSNRKRAFRD